MAHHHHHPPPHPLSPVHTRYGALVQLDALGPLVLDAVLVDNVSAIGAVLDKRREAGDEQTKKDADMVHGALFDACRTYVKWQQAATKALPTALPSADVKRRYESIREYFGSDKVAGLM